MREVFFSACVTLCILIELPCLAQEEIRCQLEQYRQEVEVLQKTIKFQNRSIEELEKELSKFKKLAIRVQRATQKELSEMPSTESRLISLGNKLRGDLKVKGKNLRDYDITAQITAVTATMFTVLVEVTKGLDSIGSAWEFDYLRFRNKQFILISTRHVRGESDFSFTDELMDESSCMAYTDNVKQLVLQMHCLKNDDQEDLRVFVYLHQMGLKD